MTTCNLKCFKTADGFEFNLWFCYNIMIEVGGTVELILCWVEKKVIELALAAKY